MEINYFKSILLGIVQGLTEFLPVSSSGHIVIAKKLLFIKSVGIFYEVFMHFGTSLSVIIVFRKEIAHIISSLFTGVKHIIINRTFDSEYVRNKNFNLGVFIVIATIPSGLIGLLFKKELSVLFDSPLFVSIALIFTGIILYITKYIRAGGLEIRFFNSLMMGCAQALAIIPGISRSGITISSGLFLKIKREDAVKFSFYLSLPVILGATILQLVEFSCYGLNLKESIQIFLAFLSAFFCGYAAIKILLKVVIAGKFYLFSYYCFFAGIMGMIFSTYFF